MQPLWKYAIHHTKHWTLIWQVNWYEMLKRPCWVWDFYFANLTINSCWSFTQNLVLCIFGWNVLCPGQVLAMSPLRKFSNVCFSSRTRWPVSQLCNRSLRLSNCVLESKMHLIFVFGFFCSLHWSVYQMIFIC